MISLNKIVKAIVGVSPPTIQWLAGMLVQGTLGWAAGIGAGGAVTQLVALTSAFTLSAFTGQIVFASSALAAYTTSSATWTNNLLTSYSVVAWHQNSGTFGSYLFNFVCSAGSAVVYVTNVSSVSLNEARAIEFGVLAGAIT